MFTFLSSSLEYIIPFLIVLTVLVFVHELGHYVVARWNGVKIEVFSIGFGPEIFGWTDKNQTRWKFSLIPLGGYVRMFGDADPSGQSVNPELKIMSLEQKNLTLSSKTPLQRIAVAAAGPLAHYLLAIVIFMGVFTIKGEPVLTNDIGAVVEKSVAERIGVKAGDRITRLNDAPISEFNDIIGTLKDLTGKDVQVEVSRPLSFPEDPAAGIPENAPRESIVLFGKMVTYSDSNEEIPVQKLGIAPGGSFIRSVGPLQSIGLSIKKCYQYSGEILSSLGQMITGQKGSGELGGILSIGSMAKESVSGGMITLIMFMAVLSVNLGLINLLPVPILDGGHILFCSIEAMTGRPVKEKIQEWAFGIGMFIVLSVMLLTTWNDISHFKVIQKITGLFH